jgi:signal transduction histidine kinase/ActR/RegA family two-component response regulator
MTHFRDLPIRRKLLLLTLASSATALALASGGFLAWDITQFRSDLVQDIDAQAAIVADNSAAPLAFRDVRAATETLALMRLRPRVTAACLYDAQGQPFASYLRTSQERCPALQQAEEGIGWSQYTVVRDVMLTRDRVGTLYIERDLADLYERLQAAGIATAVLLLVAVGAALLVARRIERTIAAPLLALADTAHAVSTGHDDSRIRAPAAAGDEIGSVVDAFNAMLDRIDERSRELSRTNAELEREVVERRRVEAERTAALERERDANRLKDEFLATLSHELRTPLGAVLGWARVLRTTRVNDAMRERALEVIERNARAQAHLIEDLLEISRIVAGKPTLKVRSVDLAEIVDAAVEVVRPAAAAKRIELVTEVAVRPALTSGDPDRLQQIVWNLVSNAVKFTPPNGTASVRLTKKDGFWLEVSDTGQGIDPTFLPHVFDAFRQADGTTTREHGGLGLGLTIARQLAELHGGTITASSGGVGRGSTFVLQLPSVVREPYAPEPLPQEHSAHRDDVEGGDLLRDVRILVVDDQEDARDLLRTMLSQYGALVTAVDSARAALEEIDQRPPDVVLSDVGMPREDGYDLIRQLRRRATQRGGRIPAIAVTAYASVADRAAALESGYQAHVAKPFDPAELARTVAGVYREHLSTS